MEDIDVVFPLRSLRSLETLGRVGGVAPHNYRFVGYATETTVLRENAREVAGRLRANHVDLALLVRA